VLSELYRLLCEESTGALECARGVIYLRRGYVRSVSLREGVGDSARLGDILSARLPPAQGLRLLRAAKGARGSLGQALVEAGVARRSDIEDALRRQTELRLGLLAQAASAAHFEPGAAPRTAEVSLPFDALPWLRAFIEAHDAAGRLDALRKTFVRVVPEPPARLLRRGEAEFARALGEGVIPESLGAEAEPLCRFLAAVSALHPFDQAARRALRSQLAELHPDRHPHASRAEKARLEARFRRLCDTYRRLGE
jgi:hypothetical protein